MKNIIILSSLFFFLFSCKMEKAHTLSARENIKKVTLSKIGKSFSSGVLIVTQDSFSFNGREVSRGGKIGSLQWKTLVSLIHEIELNKLNSFQAPTQKRFYDGALITSIEVTTINSVYTSQNFDSGAPPEQLKKLYDYLENIENNNAN